MGVEENKKIVLGFIENMSAGNGAAAFGALADSATWWVAGNFALSGTKTKAQFAEVAGAPAAHIISGVPPSPPKGRAAGGRAAVARGKASHRKKNKTNH